MPASHRHRILLGHRGNQAYVFHLIFIVLDILPAELELGIAGDISVYPTSIFWHDGSGWKQWQHMSPFASVPHHPFLSHELGLAFKLTHICLVWSREVTIRTFRSQFNQNAAIHIPELREYRQEILENARVQQILAVSYVDLDIPDIAYLITFLLRLYSHTLPTARLLRTENELPQGPRRSMVWIRIEDDDLN